MTARSFDSFVPDPELAETVQSGMTAVEAELITAVSSEDPYITEAARHLVDAGGKRFRPLLVLLAAQFGDPDAAGVVPAAVVVELTHLATLYHDDVMDEAELRRGAASANARWDNTVAILTGDFLFARASDILADLGPEAVRIQARTFERLVTGQIRETAGPRDGADPLAHYLSVVADKTGSLIATSGRLGALMAGAEDKAVEVLREYGERIGVAFQLSDDILDVASDSAEFGKQAGTDLREGVPTLPTLHAMAGTDPADEQLRRRLAGPITDDVVHAETLTALRAHPAMASARAELARWADEARATLVDLPQDTDRRRAAVAALSDLCDLVVTRTA